MSMESMDLSDIQDFLEDSSLSEKNANPANWTREEGRDVWMPADENIQKFHEMCRAGDDSQAASLFDPKSPLFALPFLQGLTPEISSIFIRSSYLTMFDILCAYSVAPSEHPVFRFLRETCLSTPLDRQNDGVILIGQPGTGKTLFNLHLLVRLLLRNQVVLYSPEGRNVYLFYHDGAYTARMKDLERSTVELPRRKPKDAFIWSLIDIYPQKDLPYFLLGRDCFPVHTASPGHDQHHYWRRKLVPCVTGLPLWTRNELAQGLPYQQQYQFLQDKLDEVYGSLSPLNPAEPWNALPGIPEVLRERFSGETPSPQEALDYLLDFAIERFGYSPRDVFSAVFNYESLTRYHKTALSLNCARLRESASHLLTQHSDDNDLYARILVLSPVYDNNPFVSADWKVDFKSDWISRSMIQQLGGADDNAILKEFDNFERWYPALAERLLELLVHRRTASATDGFWPLINMGSNNDDLPLFTFVQDIPVPDTVQFVKVERKVVKLESTASLSSCLENNAYYIPTDPAFPFFDAFTVELDHAKQSGILWVLQVTTSRMQGGSTLGYKKIREIIAIVQDELRGDPPLTQSNVTDGKATPTPSVEVRYLLVVPKLEIRVLSKSPSQDLQRQFPKGWSQDRQTYDHCGNVYCLEVPIPRS